MPLGPIAHEVLPANSGFMEDGVANNGNEEHRASAKSVDSDINLVEALPYSDWLLISHPRVDLKKKQPIPDGIKLYKVCKRSFTLSRDAYSHGCKRRDVGDVH